MDRQINTRLKITPDPQNQQTIRDIQNLRNELIKTAKEAESVGNRAKDAFGKLRSGLTGGTGRTGSAQALGQIGSQIGGPVGQGANALGQAFTSLNPAMAAVTVTTIALGLAIGELKKKQEEAKKATEAVINVIKDRAILETKTSEELTQLQTQRQADLDIAIKQRDALAELNQAMKDAEDGMGGLDGIIYDLGQTTHMLGAEQKTVEEAYKTSNIAVQQAQGLLENVAGAFDSAGNAAADAAEAAEKLAEELTEALLDSAQDAGEAVKFEADALGRSAEANEKRLEAIDAERRALEAELKILEESGDTSKKVTDKIAQLNEKLGDLGVEADTINTVLPSVQESEARQEAAEAAADAHEEAAQAAADAARRRREEARQEEEERLQDQIDFYNELQDIEFDAAQDRYQIMVDANRETDRLLREAQQSVRDALFSQDFLSIFQQYEQFAFNMREAQLASGQALQDAAYNQGVATQQAQAQYNSTTTNNNNNQFIFPNAGQGQVLMTMQSSGLI